MNQAEAKHALETARVRASLRVVWRGGVSRIIELGQELLKPLHHVHDGLANDDQIRRRLFDFSKNSPVPINRNLVYFL